MDYYILAIKNYANTQGRTTRSEYWTFFLFYVLFYIATVGFDKLLGTDDLLGKRGLLQTIYGLFWLVPSWTAMARRLHDIGKSTWWALCLGVLPIVITLFFQLYIFPKVGISIENPAFIRTLAIFLLYMLGTGIFLLVLLVKPSTPGPNKYGPDPHVAFVEPAVEKPSNITEM